MRDDFGESKINVLVVDDVVINLEILAEIVKSNGYIARTVTSVSQAQKALRELLPNLILLDISMPDMNGFDFCEIWCKILQYCIYTCK